MATVAEYPQLETAWPEPTVKRPAIEQIIEWAGKVAHNES